MTNTYISVWLCPLTTQLGCGQHCDCLKIWNINPSLCSFHPLLPSAHKTQVCGIQVKFNCGQATLIDFTEWDVDVLLVINLSCSTLCWNILSHRKKKSVTLGWVNVVSKKHIVLDDSSFYPFHNPFSSFNHQAAFSFGFWCFFFLIIFYFPFFPLLQQNTYSNFLSFFFLFFFCVLLLLNHSVDFNEITLRVVWYRRGGGRQPKVTNLDF